MTPQTHASLSVAVVEDNDTLRDLLVSYLEQPGRRVHSADCGEALNHLLQTHPLDIVVLDLNLPYEDGLSIAQRLRRSHPHIKIVMLTARVRPSDRTAGYGAGADVYLSKPTNVAELEAVISNLAQRQHPAVVPSSFLLNRHAHTLTSPQRKQVVLTPAESSILQQLALAPAEGLETEFLLAQLRRMSSNAQLNRENLAVTMSRLRQKTAAQLEIAELIQTVRNFGYRLTQPVAVE